ncbi:MAG: insulinase family protein [Leptospiraceae bacterium]|nr:insulinase family protein [Leptospiraceae bacterium]
MEKIQKFVLENNLTLLFQKIPSTQTLSIGLWVKIGSRYERTQERGYTHFLEHVLFKGTAKRTAKQIAEEIDRVGGYLNAATSREYTYFYVTVPKKELELSLDILSDMLFESIIQEKEVKNEASVILEELISYEENPEDYIHDFFYKNFLSKSGLGLEIVGTRESVLGATSKKIISYYKRHYSTDKMILSIVGDLEWQKVFDLVQKFFSKYKPNPTSPLKTSTPTKSYTFHYERRKLEQTQILIGMDGVKKDLHLAVRMSLFSHILGGGMSSRLFQKIREEKGFCYSISSYSSAYSDTGVFSIYCATSSSKFVDCAKGILDEVLLLKEKGFTAQELQDAKTNQIGSLLLSTESAEQKMMDMALQEIYFQNYFTIKDRIQAIQSVSLEELNSFKDKVIGNKVHFSVLGKLSSKQLKAVELHSLLK